MHKGQCLQCTHKIVTIRNQQRNIPCNCQCFLKMAKLETLASSALHTRTAKFDRRVATTNEITKWTKLMAIPRFCCVPFCGADLFWNLWIVLLWTMQFKSVGFICVFLCAFISLVAWILNIRRNTCKSLKGTSICTFVGAVVLRQRHPAFGCF